MKVNSQIKSESALIFDIYNPQPDAQLTDTPVPDMQAIAKWISKNIADELSK